MSTTGLTTTHFQGSTSFEGSFADLPIQHLPGIVTQFTLLRQGGRPRQPCSYVMGEQKFTILNQALQHPANLAASIHQLAAKGLAQVIDLKIEAKSVKHWQRIFAKLAAPKIAAIIERALGEGALTELGNRSIMTLIRLAFLFKHNEHYVEGKIPPLPVLYNLVAPYGGVDPSTAEWFSKDKEMGAILYFIKGLSDELFPLLNESWDVMLSTQDPVLLENNRRLLASLQRAASEVSAAPREGAVHRPDLDPQFTATTVLKRPLEPTGNQRWDNIIFANWRQFQRILTTAVTSFSTTMAEEYGDILQNICTAELYSQRYTLRGAITSIAENFNQAARVLGVHLRRQRDLQKMVVFAERSAVFEAADRSLHVLKRTTGRVVEDLQVLARLAYYCGFRLQGEGDAISRSIPISYAGSLKAAIAKIFLEPLLKLFCEEFKEGVSSDRIPSSKESIRLLWNRFFKQFMQEILKNIPKEHRSTLPVLKGTAVSAQRPNLSSKFNQKVAHLLKVYQGQRVFFSAGYIAPTQEELWIPVTKARLQEKLVYAMQELYFNLYNLDSFFHNGDMFLRIEIDELEQLCAEVVNEHSSAGHEILELDQNSSIWQKRPARAVGGEEDYMDQIQQLRRQVTGAVNTFEEVHGALAAFGEAGVGRISLSDEERAQAVVEVLEWADEEACTKQQSAPVISPPPSSTFDVQQDKEEDKVVRVEESQTFSDPQQLGVEALRHQLFAIPVKGDFLEARAAFEQAQMYFGEFMIAHKLLAKHPHPFLHIVARESVHLLFEQYAYGLGLVADPGLSFPGHSLHKRFLGCGFSDALAARAKEFGSGSYLARYPVEARKALPLIEPEKVLQLLVDMYHFKRGERIHFCEVSSLFASIAEEDIKVKNKQFDIATKGLQRVIAKMESTEPTPSLSAAKYLVYELRDWLTWIKSEKGLPQSALGLFARALFRIVQYTAKNILYHRLEQIGDPYLITSYATSLTGKLGLEALNDSLTPFDLGKGGSYPVAFSRINHHDNGVKAANERLLVACCAYAAAGGGFSVSGVKQPYKKLFSSVSGATRLLNDLATHLGQ